MIYFFYIISINQILLTGIEILFEFNYLNPDFYSRIFLLFQLLFRLYIEVILYMEKLFSIFTIILIFNKVQLYMYVRLRSGGTKAIYIEVIFIFSTFISKI